MTSVEKIVAAATILGGVYYGIVIFRVFLGWLDQRIVRISKQK